MSRDVVKALDRLYEHLGEVRKETVEKLGVKKALRIIDFHANNWIDLCYLISDEYDKDVRDNSLLFFCYTRTFKDIYWMEFLFLCANYLIAFRDLRYVWELNCQGYFVDKHYPGMCLRDKLVKVAEIEETTFGWNLVQSVLRGVGLNDIVMEKYKCLWKLLCKFSHPSVRVFGLIDVEDLSVLVTDSVDRGLAEAFLEAVDEVFDTIYLMLFNAFPKIMDRFKEYFKDRQWLLIEWSKYAPLSYRRILEVID